MKMLLLILGVLLATIGGVMIYRALYVEPLTVVISDGEIRELPNHTRVVGGTLLLVGGTALALYGATRKIK